MAEALKVGLVGCGNMGSSLMNGVAASEIGRPAGFYDVDGDRSAKLAEEYEGRAFASLEELLADDGISAIAVATMPNQHAEHVIQAARAGKHVFTEKPMALTVADCDRMIDAAREAGVTLMVGQVLRYIEPWHSILRWNREGRFGRPFHACMQRIGGAKRMCEKASWRSSLDKSGGYLFEISVHELDFMRCLMGRPTEVYAVRQKVQPADHEMEDVISMLIRFESGASAHYDGGVGWGVGKSEFILCFEKANLVRAKGFDEAPVTAIDADTQEQIPLEGFVEENAVMRQMRDWLEALRDGKPVPIPGEEGRETVRLAESAYRSAETGQVVEMP